MNYTYTVRYLNKECEQVVITFDSEEKAIAKAKSLGRRFDYDTAVCKELLGKCVGMTMYWAK